MEERIVETERAPEAPVHTTTVIHERSTSSSATGILLAFALLLAVVGALYLFSRLNQSETTRDDAVTQAAHDVGQAANKVGDAAQDAANSVNHKDN
ncbi:hypothetical protein EDF56_101112 [Novosphingobium sp. PhB165]|uniref:hypothetical protein n=1 Tax=Novosphingobium sp. PhB165 TaxID=2485105 RepID=UPI00104785E9|nr:hypothetical protein [Novosphingobium sp. PhB165]TCM21448.1 hypothetical protein EDF56_101112 [Novosphingobium sp. PhB165]